MTNYKQNDYLAGEKPAHFTPHTQERDHALDYRERYRASRGYHS